MLSKNKIRYVHSLEHKKMRHAEGLFVAEGPKVVGDLLEVMRARVLYATDQWLKVNKSAADCTEQLETVSEEELRKISFLQHPQKVVALFPIMSESTVSLPEKSELLLCLDGVQDPGNLGTIIRIADWFGIKNVVCSRDTADVYNPKVVQATMGSIARVKVSYTDLQEYLSLLPSEYPVYGTLLDGEDIYKDVLTDYGIIIMGNEGNGISLPIRKYVNKRIRIPNYPAGRATADSLNVAVATAITCAEFRRLSGSHNK